MSKKAIEKLGETGIYLPVECLRDREDCVSISQLVSSCKGSFMCVGHNDPESRKLEQDRFRVCFKNEVIDELQDWDDADMKDQISVLSYALSADEHITRAKA